MFSLQPPRHISTLPIATNFLKGPDVNFRGQAEVGGAAGSAASVENDPVRHWRAILPAGLSSAVW
jgi:hypothetical protein